METFKEAWAKKEAQGYRYSSDALEQVEFGWEMREAEIKRLTEALIVIGGKANSVDSCQWLVRIARLALQPERPLPPAGTIRQECDAPEKPKN